MFKVIAVLTYLSSIVTLLVTGELISSMLALYPTSHISSFGPVVPIVAETHVAWLPAVPAIVWAIAAVSTVLGWFLWRSRRLGHGKLLAALAIGALNYFFALFFTTTLLVVYFYLPHVANAA